MNPRHMMKRRRRKEANGKRKKKNEVRRFKDARMPSCWLGLTAREENTSEKSRRNSKHSLPTAESFVT
jgi:hypothetical protein